MRKFFLLATLGLAACGVQDQPPLDALAATTVSGTVTLLQPVTDAQVCVYSLKGATRASKPTGCTSTDESGNWSMRAGKLYGTVVAEASGGVLTSPLTALATGIGQFENAQPIHITPISHLTAGLAEKLYRRDVVPSDAMYRAQHALNTHFASVPHEITQPWQPASSDKISKPVEVTGSVLAHLFLAGFDQLARQVSHRDGRAENTFLTMQSLVALLYEDVQSDGYFDGKGTDSKQLFLGSMPLSDKTLRKPLADAIAVYLFSPRNVTGLVATDIAPVLKALSLSRTDCLSSPTPDNQFTDAGPELSACHAVTQDGARTSLDHPQSGEIKIVCSWNDPAGIKLATIDVVDPTAEEAFEDQTIENIEVARRVDTARLEALYGEGAQVELALTATNMLGYTTSHAATLRAQNTQPEVTLQDQPTEWLKRSDGLSVKGSVNRPIRTVSLLVQKPEQSASSELKGTVQRFTYESNTRDFRASLTAPFVCDGVLQAHLGVEDWSGHKYQRIFHVQCDEMPPLLRLARGVYQNDFGGDQVLLFPWDSVLTFNKFFHKLDYLPEQGLDIASQNLPAIRFTVDNQTGPTLEPNAEALKVEYRHDMPEHRGAWSSLTANKAGEYTLPIAYQTLLPASHKTPGANYIASSALADMHEITVRMTDLLGNVSSQVFAFRLNLRGPPVKMYGCGPTGALLGGRLHESNLNFVYSPGFALYDAEVAYSLGLPEHSLAPSAPVNVALTSLSVMSRVKKVKESWRHVLSAHQSRHISWAGRRGMQTAVDGCVEVLKSPSCRGNRRIAWSDGSCIPLRAPSVYPFEQDHAVSWQSSQSVLLRSLNEGATYEDDPDQSVAHVRIDPDVPARVRTNMATGRFSLGTPSATERGSDDANAINWERSVQLKDLTRGVVAHRMYGVETKGDTYHYIDRTFIISNLEMTVQPPQARLEQFIEHTPTLTPQEYHRFADMPLPVSIEMDQSCILPVTLSWDRNVSEPTLH